MPAQVRRRTFHAGRPAGEHVIHRLLRVHARTCESHARELGTTCTLGVTDQTCTIQQPALGFLARAGVRREAGIPACAGGRPREIASLTCGDIKVLSCKLQWQSWCTCE